jgi:hypothetical protein
MIYSSCTFQKLLQLVFSTASLFFAYSWKWKVPVLEKLPYMETVACYKMTSIYWADSLLGALPTGWVDKFADPTSESMY